MNLLATESKIKFIKKRTGDIVEFDVSKIGRALQKSFTGAGVSMTDFQLAEIANQVIEKAEKLFVEVTPTVENIQNLVEEALMTAGYFNVAKSYIIYRYEHTKIREEKKQEVLEKIERNDLMVVKRNGQAEKFSAEKLKKSLVYSSAGFEDVIDFDNIVDQCQKELYENITTPEIDKALILTTRARIERDPAYSKVAARLLANSLYKEVIGTEFEVKNLTQQYRDAFVKSIKTIVSIGTLDPRVLLFDLDKLAASLVIERDDLFQYLGLQVLADRYFVSEPLTRRILETPQMFWMRVAMGMAIEEADRDARAVEFYEVMSTLRYVPSTPTLFHAGTKHPQLSSCYLTTVEDSLDHIFKSIGDNAQLSKWSGGIGNDWTNLRGMGALIKGTGVESQGIIPFLKIANDTTVAINRSGRRRGATCAYLEAWHWDVEDFIDLRRNTGDERRRTHDMDTALWIPDLMMKRIEEDGNWTLFSPDETPELHHIYGKEFEARYKYYEDQAAAGNVRLFKTMRAADLWRKILSMLFETGHPWITFKDPSNVRSPQDHVGVIHHSNLCTEIMLNTSAEETAVCNLGSVNIPRHLVDGKLDTKMLEETVTTAMRMLDNVIDVNFYPTPEAKYANMRHRPVGLGIMGLQDALFEMGINFDSQSAVDFSDELMEQISYFAILGSSRLAKERGTYQTYPGSKWDRGLFPIDTIALLEEHRGQKIDVNRHARMDWQLVRDHVAEFGMRNSNTMAIAPTATISNIVGSNPSIEPIYKNVYVKSNMSGEFIVVNAYLVDALKAEKLWNQEMLNEIKRHEGDISDIDAIPKDIRETYKETFAIDSEWLIRAAAVRSKWIDQSQSLNIFVKGSSGKRLSDIYQYAWKMGLKTTYYLRSLAATSIEQSGITLNTSNALDAANASTTATTAVASEDISQGFVAPVESAPVAPVAVAAQETEAKSVGAAVMSTTASADQGAASGVAAFNGEGTTKIYGPSDAVNEDGVKLCLIDDPNCEACQ